MNAVEADKVTTSDYEKIALLLQEYRGQSREVNFWLERFAYWWDENPFFKPGMTKGYVLRQAEDIVGFIGLIPMPFWMHGTEQITFSPAAWYVLPKFRGRALTLYWSLLRETSHTIQWHTTGNKRTCDLFVMLGVQLMPYIFKRRFIVYAGGAAYWHDMALQRVWPMHLQWMLHIMQKRLAPRRFFAVEGMRVVQLHRVDACFDRLWERTRSPTMATKARSSEWLNWYCFGWPSRPKILFGCFQGNELEGYAVFHPRIVHGELFWECLDVWTDSFLSYCGDALFSFALVAVAQHGGKGLISHDYPSIRSWLERRFWKIVTGEDPGGYWTGPPEMLRKIYQGCHYFTLGEGDQGM